MKKIAILHAGFGKLFIFSWCTQSESSRYPQSYNMKLLLPLAGKNMHTTPKSFENQFADVCKKIVHVSKKPENHVGNKTLAKTEAPHCVCVFIIVFILLHIRETMKQKMMIDYQICFTALTINASN